MKRCIVVLIILFAVVSCQRKTEETAPDPAPVPVTLEVPVYFGKYDIPADNPLTKQGIALGRMLFYEKLLSADNTVSCASCHKQQFAFSDDQALSKGAGQKLGKRNAMAIINMLWQGKDFFWDGRASSLEHQAIFPIQDSLEMNQQMEATVKKLQNSTIYTSQFKAAFGTSGINSDLIFKALSQFERTLISSDSKYDRFISGKYSLTAQETNGKNLFLTHPEPKINLRGGNCNDCHSGFMQTDKQFRNNGLDEVLTDPGRDGFTNDGFDKGKFRVPTLRNIALTAPYMHDGRFKTLEEVLDHYNEHIKPGSTLDPLIIAATNTLGGKTLALTKQEKEDIIAFLHTLTDSTFINNQAYSDPFK